MCSLYPAVCSCIFLYAGCGALSGQAVRAPSPTAAGLTLEEAIVRAKANEPLFAAADAEAHASALERKNARAAFFPKAVYHNQVVYTQPDGASNRIGQTASQPAPVFIANNAVREYASQGVFTETFGLAQVAAVRLADATAARAAAELEVARRGLTAAVVNLFYTVLSSAEKTRVAYRALAEANHFVEITQKREAARETAHADVLKAQLQQQQRQRESAETELGMNRAKLELGVLIFPDPSTPYDLEEASDAAPLPDRAQIESAARVTNPELRSAQADVQINAANTYAAKAALLPDLALNFTYGIDAPQFAHYGPTGTRNLGYSMSATLDIPLWDWLTTERTIKASRYREQASQIALTAVQRRLIANLAEFYAEAATAQAQLTSLNQSVSDARESLRLINLRYTNGESTVLEVVDAQTTLITTENALLDGGVRYRLALAQLQTLTGRL